MVNAGVQDWALGVLHAKIITAATMMGPQWRLKHVIEQVSCPPVLFTFYLFILLQRTMCTAYVIMEKLQINVNVHLTRTALIVHMLVISVYYLHE